jgi:hypothetical protein
VPYHDGRRTVKADLATVSSFVDNPGACAGSPRSWLRSHRCSPLRRSGQARRRGAAASQAGGKRAAGKAQFDQFRTAAADLQEQVDGS